MNRASLHIAVLLLPAGLAGCVPYPHTVVRVPEIRGMLSDAGAPVSNATVMIAQRRDEAALCQATSIQGVTSAGGEFLVAKKLETELFYSFLNPPDRVGQITHLCFQPEGEDVFYGGMITHMTASFDPVEVNCDMTSAHRAPLVGQTQICGTTDSVRR